MSAVQFYISDATHKLIRQVTVGGNIEAVDITYPSHDGLAGQQGICFDQYGHLYVCDVSGSQLFQVNLSLVATRISGGGVGPLNGPAIDAAITPQTACCDSAGNIYISLDGPNQVVCINLQSTSQTILGQVIPAGYMAVVAGNGSQGFSGDGGQATSAELHGPQGVAVDAAGNLYIGDILNFRIRKVNTSGVISTIAGTGTQSYTGDGGPATSATIGHSLGVCCDPAGNVYLSGSLLGNWSYIRVINTQATTQEILNVSVGAGEIQTVAGGLGVGYSGDGGAATSAELGLAVWQMFIDPATLDMYFIDLNNFRVRTVNSSTGIITTVAGNGTSGSSGNGSAATSAEFGNLQGLAQQLPPIPEPTALSVSPTSLAFTNLVWCPTLPSVGSGVPGFGQQNPQALSITASGNWTISSATGLSWFSQSSGSGNASVAVGISADFDFPRSTNFNRVLTGSYSDTLTVTSNEQSVEVGITYSVGYGDQIREVAFTPNVNPASIS